MPCSDLALNVIIENRKTHGEMQNSIVMATVVDEYELGNREPDRDPISKATFMPDCVNRSGESGRI